MVVDMELENAKKDVLELMNEKNKIETELQENKIVLEANRIGMDDSLVDSEGYPRADIDVYQVRHARHKIICLQNDYKSIMKKIENGLIKVHSIAGGNQSNRKSTETKTDTEHQASSLASIEDDETYAEPFLKVDLVTPGSPAEQAGILENDLILEFGTVNAQNFKTLKDIGELVEQCRYKPINVKVRRSDKKSSNLTLIPRPWSGRGLLGCKVIPLESVER